MEKYKYELLLYYKYVPISVTLSSVNTLCKAKNCKVNKRVLKSIYDCLDSSCTAYETMLSCDVCRDREVYRSTFEVTRSFTKTKYYIIDSAFPLFRGLYCLRDNFSTSDGKIREVTQHELNLYKSVIEFLYYFERKIDSYDEEKVKGLYTEFEWNILLPDLLTSLVLGIISYKEEEMLLEMLNRDVVIASLLDKISELCTLKSPIHIKPILEDFNPIIVTPPTVSATLREYICMFLALAMGQILKEFKPFLSNLNLRSVSDFRIIFELLNEYSFLEVNLDLSVPQLGTHTFRFISEDSKEIPKKYFTKEVLKVGKSS